MPTLLDILCAYFTAVAVALSLSFIFGLGWNVWLVGVVIAFIMWVIMTV